MKKIIEVKKIEYYLALRATPKNHKTNKEDIGPWIIFMLDALIAQADKAKRLRQSEDPHKLLSENQKQIYDLFNDNNELGVKELKALPGKQIPQATIK